MSTFLKTFFCSLLAFSLFFTHALLAQCSIKKIIKNNITTAETADRYQYLRTDKQYYGLSIKTVLIKKAQLKTYNIVIKYTGGSLEAQPINLNFRLKDDYTLTAKLKFVKSQKVDNTRVSTNIYEIFLAEEDFSRLKLTPLKEIQIIVNKSSNPVVITVDDEAFIQNQITCLQNAELN